MATPRQSVHQLSIENYLHQAISTTFCLYLREYRKISRHRYTIEEIAGWKLIEILLTVRYNLSMKFFPSS